MTEKTTLQKLLLKPGRAIALVNAPESMEETLSPLPEFARFSREVDRAEVVLCFVKDAGEFDRYFRDLTRQKKAEAVLWVAFPAKKGRAVTNLDRDKLHAYVRRFGWAGATLVILDDHWSALRFKPL